MQTPHLSWLEPEGVTPGPHGAALWERALVLPSASQAQLQSDGVLWFGLEGGDLLRCDTSMVGQDQGLSRHPLPCRHITALALWEGMLAVLAVDGVCFVDQETGAVQQHVAFEGMDVFAGWQVLPGRGLTAWTLDGEVYAAWPGAALQHLDVPPIQVLTMEEDYPRAWLQNPGQLWLYDVLEDVIRGWDLGADAPLGDLLVLEAPLEGWAHGAAQELLCWSSRQVASLRAEEIRCIALPSAPRGARHLQGDLLVAWGAEEAFLCSRQQERCLARWDAPAPIHHLQVKDASCLLYLQGIPRPVTLQVRDDQWAISADVFENPWEQGGVYSEETRLVWYDTHTARAWEAHPEPVLGITRVGEKLLSWSHQTLRVWSNIPKISSLNTSQHTSVGYIRTSNQWVTWDARGGVRAWRLDGSPQAAWEHPDAIRKDILVAFAAVTNSQDGLVAWDDAGNVYLLVEDQEPVLRRRGLGKGYALQGPWVMFADNLFRGDAPKPQKLILYRVDVDELTHHSVCAAVHDVLAMPEVWVSGHEDGAMSCWPYSDPDARTSRKIASAPIHLCAWSEERWLAWGAGAEGTLWSAQDHECQREPWRGALSLSNLHLAHQCVGGVMALYTDTTLSLVDATSHQTLQQWPSPDKILHIMGSASWVVWVSLHGQVMWVSTRDMAEVFCLDLPGRHPVTPWILGDHLYWTVRNTLYVCSLHSVEITHTLHHDTPVSILGVGRGHLLLSTPTGVQVIKPPLDP